jgi:hypothetical protein
MNPIGNIKAFMIDVMINIAIVFGAGYMGGSLVALSHLDNPTLNKIFPVDLNESPYVGEKKGFSFTGYSFPYTLYEANTEDFFAKVINWLVMTCAYVFIGMRNLFRKIASIQNASWFTGTYGFADLCMFYLVPLLLVSIAVYARSLTSTFIILIALYSMFAGQYLFQEKKMMNGIWYGVAPLSFWYSVFFMKMEPGIVNLILKMLLSFIAFLGGCFALFVVYPFWWTAIITVAILYYIVYLFFSPVWYGFDKIIEEMGNHRISLMILFMVLTIYSSQSFLVSLATSGIIAGSIYMLYLLFKNKINLNRVFSLFKNNVKK